MSRKALDDRVGNLFGVVRPRRARALAIAIAISSAGLALFTAVAAAHPSFDLASVPASSTERLRLSVPVESADDAVTNQEIDLHLPAGFDSPGCLPSLGWRCEVDDADAADLLVRWTRVGGLTRPEAFDLFVDTPAKLGTYVFVVVQGRTDSSVIRWADPPAGRHPAPRLQVTAAGTDTEPNDSPPASHAPTTTVLAEPSPPVSTVASHAPPPPGADADAGLTSTSAATSTTAGSTSTLDGSTTTGEILEPGEQDATPPGEMSLGLPAEDDDRPDGMKLTPARVALGVAGLFGALLSWLVVRRANQPA